MTDAHALPSALVALIEQSTALIFDCDGTLVESAPVYGRAWEQGFALTGRRMEHGWYRERIGLSESVLLDEFAQLHGVTLDRPAIVQAMRRAFLRNLPQVQEVPVICALARRYHRNKPLAVASGGPEEIVVATLTALDLLPLFDVIVTVDDVAAPKPSPAIFLETARRLNQAPADCLVFEDSDQGLEAARRGGFPCIDVRSLS